MVCIYCTGFTRVSNSRHQKRANTIWRRRVCLQCGAIFTSREYVDLSESLRVAKHANTSELAPFIRDQLFIDIYASCRHRPAALADAAALTQTVIDRLIITHKSGLILRSEIIGATIEALNNFDAAAATFYRAYHQAT